MNRIKEELPKLRIAFVKQDVYQDLYVVPTSEHDPAAILFSSMGRVGPIGLMADLGADFYIVKEDPEPETQIYRKVVPGLSRYFYLLKTETLDKIPGQEFKRPGSPVPQGRYAVAAENIDWGTYDVVISVNVSLPARLVRKYPRTLFAYMIGEANLATHKARFGYDVTLNQMARGIVATGMGEIDFPYTFLRGDTLQRIMYAALGRAPKKQGVFMEINSTRERPVTRVPDHFLPLQDAGQPVHLHRQLIRENLTAIYDAKYFVKMGGRPIRGNSVAEAVSLGTLAIMDSREVTHHELIIPECDVRTMDDVLALIRRCEAEPAYYATLVDRQQATLDDLFFRRPIQSLAAALDAKRNSGPAPYGFWQRLSDRISTLNMKRGWKH